MSDVIKAFDLCKCKENIRLSTDHCLTYVQKDCVSGNEIVFTVNIPFEFLRSCHELKEKGRLAEFSYVQILNTFISRYGIKIKEDCERIEGLLRRKCSEVRSKSRKVNGRRNAVLMIASKNIAICQDELTEVHKIENNLKRATENVEILIEENAKLQA